MLAKARWFNMGGSLSKRRFSDAWVIVETRKQEFAIPAIYVREVVVMPEITTIPQRGPEYRGVINLCGSILTVIDMRKQFGWQSVAEELEDFFKMMTQREQDHRNWLNELERSVVQGTEFRLARDHRQCAFGKWFYSYKSESPWVMALLQKFELPHSEIHAPASSIFELMKNGRNAKVLPMIENARNGVLQEMVSLFQQLRSFMLGTVKELAMVITLNRGTFAVSIDSALGVERIASDMIKEVQINSASLGRGLVHRAAQRSATGSLAMILEPERFLSSPHAGRPSQFASQAS